MEYQKTRYQESPQIQVEHRKIMYQENQEIPEIYQTVRCQETTTLRISFNK